MNESSHNCPAGTRARAGGPAHTLHSAHEARIRAQVAREHAGGQAAATSFPQHRAGTPSPQPAAPRALCTSAHRLPERRATAPARLHEHRPPAAMPVSSSAESALSPAGAAGALSPPRGGRLRPCPRSRGGQGQMRQGSAAVTSQRSSPRSTFNHRTMAALEPNGRGAKSWRPRPPLP